MGEATVGVVVAWDCSRRRVAMRLLKRLRLLWERLLVCLLLVYAVCVSVDVSASSVEKGSAVGRRLYSGRWGDSWDP
jgi:hypothetical protein